MRSASRAGCGWFGFSALGRIGLLGGRGRQAGKRFSQGFEFAAECGNLGGRFFCLGALRGEKLLQDLQLIDDLLLRCFQRFRGLYEFVHDRVYGCWRRLSHWQRHWRRDCGRDTGDSPPGERSGNDREGCHGDDHQPTMEVSRRCDVIFGRFGQ